MNVSYDYEMKIYTIQTTDGIEYVAEFPELKGCIGSGKTYQEALQEALENKAVYLEVLEEMGSGIPTPNANYSGKLSLRLTPFLHKQIAQVAKGLGVSINQYIVETLAISVGKHIKNQ